MKPIYLLAVSGSRDITDVAWVEAQLQEEIGKVSADHEVILVLGDCPKGVDSIARQWASLNGMGVLVAQAHWGTFRKSAGPIRNGVMVRVSDGLLALWDGVSLGTKNAAFQAEAFNKLRRVVIYGREET